MESLPKSANVMKYKIQIEFAVLSCYRNNDTSVWRCINPSQDLLFLIRLETLHSRYLQNMTV